MRRVHRKTRTGCTQCKRRRVKCDERKPSCANCDRNKLQCSLKFLTPLTSLSRGRLIKSAPATPRAPAGRSYLFTAIISPELSPLHFDNQTSELLHHYTTIFYHSLADNRPHSIWHVTIPQMGLEHPFLLSGILAISALHLSTLAPHREHELQNFAITQASSALPSFRKSMNNPTTESIHAIFAFAGFLVYYIMGLPNTIDAGQKVDRCRIPTRDDTQPHWFQTIRGLMALLFGHWNELAKGPFSPLLIEAMNDPDKNNASSKADDEQLAKLEAMFPPNSSSLPLDSNPPFNSFPYFSTRSHHLWSDNERKAEICKEALNELRKLSALSHSSSRTLHIKTSNHGWAGIVSQDFAELIYDKDPRALVLLAHYCVLLKRNNHVWYLRGLGPGLLENIRQALGKEWRPWIQWALYQPIS